MNYLAVTGYASLDYAIGLSGQIAGDTTTLIDFRDPGAWPRIGGCPAYVAAAAARHNQTIYPVSWVGADDHGDHYLKGLTAAGALLDGVSRLDDRRSPMSILAYQCDGSCACLFDPGFSGEEELDAAQRQIIADASHLCITVGPPQLMETIMKCRSSGARLYWVLKSDEHSFTPQIREKLSAGADVIFCSRSERHLIGDAARETIIVETRGTDGIAVDCNGESRVLPVSKVPVRDTTGAGDSFAGGFIGAQMSGVSDPIEAALAGIASARHVLEQRSAREAT